MQSYKDKTGEVFYGRTVRRSEGSRTAKGIVGRRMALSDGGWRTDGFYFFLEPPTSSSLAFLAFK